MPSSEPVAGSPAGRGAARMPTRAGSLRRRLLVGAALWIALALLLAGTLIAWLLTRAVETQIYDGLAEEVDRLVAALSVTPDGGLTVARRPADPAFARPYSGHYWQVGELGAVAARSRSLWDQVLPLPADVLTDGQVHRHAIDGPRGQRLIVVERAVVLPGLDRRTRVAVAIDRAVVTEVTRPAILTLAASLLVLAVGLVLAAWLQVTAGLRPLERLRRAVARVADGEARLVGEGWPEEVAPLATELDAVLASNRRIAEVARRQAADLAHGLRTRLAVAANEADALGERDSGTARRLMEELGAARRLLDRHLARARAGGAAPGLRSRVPAADTVDRVADVVARLAGRDLAIERRLEWDAVFLGDRSDLEEMAGNLLDNAAKWARRRVRLAASRHDGRLRLTVEDDGPGIPEADRIRALDPGVRLDQQAPGSGLGLAIVGELAAAYGGALSLDTSPLGGLRATVTLPSG